METLKHSQHERKWWWAYDLLFLVVLLAGTYFRFTGVNWDENNHVHPDERFLTMVESALQIRKCSDPQLPVEVCPEEQKRWLSLSDYFNSTASTLNPYNRGYGFYVYGTLPLFLVRFVAELTDQTGYDQVYLIGRQLSALADLLTLVLLYMIVTRIYGRRVALLAVAFDAVAVMQIQQSHFFTVDSFVNFFMFLTLYFAVEIAFGGKGEAKGEGIVSMEAADPGTQSPDLKINFRRAVSSLLRDRLFWLSLAFGICLGMAAASKINAVFEALLLPAAFMVRHYRSARQEGNQGGVARERYLGRIVLLLVVGALASIIAFRVFQPYAFTGPGFFGVKPVQGWIDTLRAQRLQAGAGTDLVWALQWARRTHLYSFQNLTVWGLGLPLGILAWAGFLWMGWRMLKGEWRQHALLWGWTAAYFLWQSMQFNPTMRYQLPVYPLLAMMAAWLIIWLWDNGRRRVEEGRRSIFRHLSSIAAVTLGLLVLSATAAWAFAFTRIYTRTETRLAASHWIYQNVPGPLNLIIQQADGSVYQQAIPVFPSTVLNASVPFETWFVARADGALTEILLQHVADTARTGPQTLSVSIAPAPNPQPEQILASVSLTADFAARSNPLGESYLLVLKQPLLLAKDQTYYIRLTTTGGALTFTGAVVDNDEPEYDLGLPFPVVGYDPHVLYQSLYVHVYWDDNAEKLIRFLDTLDQSEYIFIPSNHQFAQIVRLPERYPLTTTYYRELIGCPVEKDIIWCYNEAEPGVFQGRLGFDLVKVVTSYPNLGPFEINDQYAEEAFTIYDHVKVFIFKKSPDYDAVKVEAVLSAVDLTHVVHLLPGQAAGYKTLMLPADQLAVQQAGGTWSEMFSYQALQNRYPVIGLVVWYLAIFVLGLFAYPIVRMALPGLADKGYPLARIAGLVLWAWLSWLAGSAGATYSKLTIGLALAGMAILGGVLAYLQRGELKEEWREKRKYFLLVEGLFLIFFLLDLFIRLGNPDLWDLGHGGERPMEFSYFNAVLKSTTFPPYDPWFAGGYINYYYYGYVIVGTPVKFLGIVPSIAYNFILPTLFACLALGSFSVGWNLLANGKSYDTKLTWKSLISQRSFIGGIAGTAAIILVGNLGLVRMLYRGFMCLGAPGVDVHNCSLNPTIHAPEAGLFQRLIWVLGGGGKALGGAPLGFGVGEWYYSPSRVISPDEANGINEFPLFTFIHSDLHAHMMALPLAVLAIAWALSVILALKNSRFSLLSASISLGFGALVIGALKPANTWDFYTYLALGGVALVYGILRYLKVGKAPFNLQPWMAKGGYAILAVGLLAGLSMLFYQPFNHWFGQAYTAIDRWGGYTTLTSEYLTHWGFFLFVIVSWMVWETHQWMAQTPVSALNRLRPYRFIIKTLGILLLALVAILLVMKIWIAWLALPLAAWAGVLLLRPGMPDAKRGVLFMIGTSLVITLFVEIFVLRGDVGRMNTLFKFYLQAWVMFGLSAAAGFVWVMADVSSWIPGWRIGWQVVVTLLFSFAGLYLLLGSIDRISYRWNPKAPHTLDSMTYMKYVQLPDFGELMNLDEDYRAIRWMQDNVKGSPVIVEAKCTEYRWCTRFTVYTGLPGVIGWANHQRQQRALTSPQVDERILEVNAFYTTTDADAAYDFLCKYNVRYIIVGQLERAAYPGVGLGKFEDFNGTFWQKVYLDGETAIYEVLP